MDLRSSRGAQIPKGRILLEPDAIYWNPMQSTVDIVRWHVVLRSNWHMASANCPTSAICPAVAPTTEYTRG